MLFEVLLPPCPQKRDTSWSAERKVKNVFGCTIWVLFSIQYWVKMAKKESSSTGISDFKPVLHKMSFVLQDILLQMRTSYSRTTQIDFLFKWFHLVLSLHRFYTTTSLPDLNKVYASNIHEPSALRDPQPFWGQACASWPQLSTWPKAITEVWPWDEWGRKKLVVFQGVTPTHSSGRVAAGSDPQQHWDFSRTVISLNLDGDIQRYPTPEAPHCELQVHSCNAALIKASSDFEWMHEYVDHTMLLEKEDRRRAESAVVTSISTKLFYPYLSCVYCFSTGADRDMKNKTMALKTPRGTAWWLVSAQLISSAIKPLAVLLESVGPRFTDVNAQLLFQG